ncbi:30S ribosomal protein S6 [Candidatus Uhrbacteria bacterium RIFCSPLOWO2_12_FULL_46_10]|uniref:Small ribosomal subunit protein bS6 n=1 Tax=Candidatus Uhrbacteria bacterium RIFCSPLOWO2_01_FULL_47_25 TaxID=1802402 RepID=A0A1F7UTD8_9BACT|nr:MAG: 30S ribosomal protein S6 [Candidatus Uhrbacteria bacterium RIFCSPHIGHO2_01_FULL_46_23]OGL67865.1 MAG: 30S ribosomal protein S6 [Candidatus Uhrbacteria bacterium RIFCSPHIGHO2_02_FULL_47_29]OGL81519.1 MAG: 30S ribosomal protein S6 [Candidatus Uhrbacteria bacterium RIFCSPLOWO2_01_FULL_47_25]OGL85741.1 MAG: 30S ribosomal protein S6 [Candidatus Uhrbacteria bacterium RIFCSPLOWO2_02_FULL_46_19]OGL90612.1 MAG: 30S ribosomal protein S6 [Candidatus Uhrbacteria bacterium RIFCSPLOWO2_12_FULL_46_10]
MYILPPTLTEDEVPGATEKITNLLKDNGAEITKEVDLGKKRLAYPIEHHQYGYYRLLELSAEPSRLAKINSVLRLATNVMRHQIIVKPIKSQVTVEREQALRARLAVKRQQRAAAEAPSVSAPEPSPVSTPSLTPEELEKKIEKILEENPNV